MYFAHSVECIYTTCYTYTTTAACKVSLLALADTYILCSCSPMQVSVYLCIDKQYVRARVQERQTETIQSEGERGGRSFALWLLFRLNPVHALCVAFKLGRFSARLALLFWLCRAWFFFLFLEGDAQALNDQFRATLRAAITRNENVDTDDYFNESLCVDLNLTSEVTGRGRYYGTLQAGISMGFAISL